MPPTQSDLNQQRRDWAERHHHTPGDRKVKPDLIRTCHPLLQRVGLGRSSPCFPGARFWGDGRALIAEWQPLDLTPTQLKLLELVQSGFHQLPMAAGRALADPVPALHQKFLP
jgi:hypothetical protein